jgi:hypothetical protein
MTAASNFFAVNSARLYLSNPVVNNPPFKYTFVRMLFAKESTTDNTVDNVSISSLEFIEDKYLLQPPDVTESMEYDYVYDEDIAYTVTDTEHYYKNATFTASKNLSRYTKTYLKPDQILGMLGGVSFFIILLFRCFAQRHNKYKMYIEIGDRLMVM